MILSADLRAEVLHRLADGRPRSPSRIAQGPPALSTGAVWACVERLYEEGVVDQSGAETYRLARRPIAQMHMDVGGMG